MTVGIVGLGLIGGSFAKAYFEAGETVLAFDHDRSVLDFAVMSGVSEVMGNFKKLDKRGKVAKELLDQGDGHTV